MTFTSKITVAAFALLVIGGSLILPRPAFAAVTGYAVPSEGQDNTSAANVAGSWQLSWTDDGGNAKQGSIDIKQDGAKLTGTFSGARGTFPLSGSLTGNHVTLTIGPAMRRFTLTGDVDGSKMSGTTPQGKDWSAAKQ